MFGSSSTFGNASSTPSFGMGSTSTSQPAAGGFSFGNTNNTNNSTTNTGATGFGFGNTNTATSTAPGTTGGLFGSTTTPASTGSTGFGFGSTATTNTGGGLFGSSTNTSQPAAGGLFGSSTNTSQPAAGGLFGNTAQKPTGTGLFGNTNTGSSLFSNTTTNTGSGGLFGSKPAGTTGFGAPSTSGGLFGSTQNTGSSLFGSSNTGGMFGSTQQPAQQQNQQQLQSFLSLQRPVPTTWENIALMKESWDPQSPLCLFKHYFYNLVHPSEVHLYQRPANQDETLWNEAQKANPNPKCMVPVLAVGFDDIKKRTEQQEMQALAHKTKLEEISDKLKKLQEKHSLDTSTKMKEYKRRHMDLAHRVLQLMKQVQVLRNKGYSIRPEEEALKTRLENLHLELRKPSQYRSRLNELWSQVQMLKNTRRSNSRGNWEFEVSDEEQLAIIQKVLAEQQSGLAHVMEVLQKDIKDVAIITRSLSEGNSSA